MEKEPFENDENKLKVDLLKEQKSKKKCELAFWQKILIICIIFTIWIVILITELVFTKGDNTEEYDKN